MEDKPPYPMLQRQLAELTSNLELQQICHEQAQSFFDRAEEAVRYGMSLDKDDGKTLIAMEKSYHHLQEQLEASELTLKKLRKLLGMEPSSEKHPKKSSQKNEEQQAKDKPQDKKEPAPGHGKRGASDFKDVESEHHKLDGLSKGDNCPECLTGKVYKYEPSVMIRISGHSLYEVTIHVCERLRCNACGKFFTAGLSEEALNVGPRGERFGYSARPLIAIDKYMAGSPFYRQENLSKILGSPISASTAFEQCEKSADAGHILQKALSQMASQAPKIFKDDIRHRIRDAEPIEKNGKKCTGVYTSALIVFLGCFR